MRALLTFCLAALLASPPFTARPQGSETADRLIDFRYAPANGFSLICLPDDWQKSVVTRSGELGFDFGPGPYARLLTLVRIDAAGESLAVVRQWLPEGRVPVVHTELRAAATTLDQFCFSLIPKTEVSPTGLAAGGRVRREGGLNGCRDWASPPAPDDPLFRSVAWGTNRPILYRVQTARGSRAKVALGFCESYKPRAGTRLLECRVEGAPHRVVDPLQSGAAQTPHVELFDGHDADRDGSLTIEVHPVAGSDPNVILNAFWLFPDTATVSREEIIAGSPRASLAYSCGLENEETVSAMRCDALSVTLRGDDCTPRIRIQTRRLLSLDHRTGTILADAQAFLFCRPAPDTLFRDGKEWYAPLRRGTRRVEVFAVHGRVSSLEELRATDLESERVRAERWWKAERRIPRSRFTLGDSTASFLLDASLRNLYQAREEVDGHLQFQPGPTVYRGLWVGDVVLSGIPSFMFGDTNSLPLMLENALRFQSPSGQVRVMVPTTALSETPLVLTAMFWYSLMKGDDAWLKARWGNVRDGIGWIRSMREQTLLEAGTPYRGLMPPGFVDGGISHLTADYGTIFWSLSAVELASQAAQRIGRKRDAAAWSQLAEQFRESLEASLQRDARRDALGNLYIPVAVGDTGAIPPERGQFAVLLPLRYGRFLHRRTPLLDTLVKGTLRMLDATRVEGLIANSGWLARGLWPWLGTAHAIACQMLDDPKAIDILYAVANHASEAGTWVEEQLPRTLGTTWTGDGSNAEASGMFLHLVRNALLFERLDTLHCLATVPPEWLKNGTRTGVSLAPTLFGPVSITVSVSGDGTRARLSWNATRPRPSAHALIHLGALRRAGFRSMNGTAIPDKIVLTFGQRREMLFRRP